MLKEETNKVETPEEVEKKIEKIIENWTKEEKDKELQE